MLATNAPKQRVQIMLEKPQRDFLSSEAESTGLSMSALVRQIIEDYKVNKFNRSLEEAAIALSSEYETSEELTNFTDLDSEDFA